MAATRDHGYAAHSFASNSSCGGYLPVRELGRGAYGRAVLVKRWKNEEQRDQELFVAKQCTLRDLSDTERRLCLQEIELLQRLGGRHPCIAQLRDVVWFSDHRYWLILDFYAGGDLEGRIAQASFEGMPRLKILNWFAQLAMALKFLHARGIMHRDVKPANVFLTKAENAVLGDLGICKARCWSAQMHMSGVLGSPHYMAPEWFDSDAEQSTVSAGFSADMWSAGVVLFELCFLQRPFLAANMLSIVRQVTEEDEIAVPPQGWRRGARARASASADGNGGSAKGAAVSTVENRNGYKATSSAAGLSSRKRKKAAVRAFLRGCKQRDAEEAAAGDRENDHASDVQQDAEKLSAAVVTRRTLQSDQAKTSCDGGVNVTASPQKKKVVSSSTGEEDAIDEELFGILRRLLIKRPATARLTAREALEVPCVKRVAGLVERWREIVEDTTAQSECAPNDAEETRPQNNEAECPSACPMNLVPLARVGEEGEDHTVVEPHGDTTRIGRKFPSARARGLTNSLLDAGDSSSEDSWVAAEDVLADHEDL